MNTIFPTYIDALLADAAYALGKPEQGDLTNKTGAELTTYLNERMTPTLAKYIGDNFAVVSHLETADVMGSGFDGTVWRDRSGKIYVSLQGTTGLQDFLSDVDLALASGGARQQVAGQQLAGIGIPATSRSSL